MKALLLLLATTATAALGEDAKDALDALENVWNCRDVAELALSIPKYRLARCGSPHNASEADAALIHARLRPATVLDLRTHEEVALDEGKVFPGALRKHVMLGDRRIMALEIMRRASLSDVATFIYLRLFEGRAEANLHMGSLIGGLAGLNEIILRKESEALNEALRVIASSSAPVLVHCTAGKDRTGIVIALALAAAGVEEAVVVDEYHLSHRHRSVIRDRAMRGVMKASETDDWAGAPKEVMRRTFAHIRSEYGGVEAYLDGIGFDRVWRRRLRRALMGASGEASAFLLL